MTIIIIGENQIHCDRISVVDGHMIECPSKIVTGPALRGSSMINGADRSDLTKMEEK